MTQNNSRSSRSIQVWKTTINLGTIQLDAYTDLEPNETGKHRNFLSGRGMAEAVGLDESAVRRKRLPKSLEALLGRDSSVRSGFYLEGSNNFKNKVSLWDTRSASKFFVYHSAKGNSQATQITLALIEASLDNIIDDRFGRHNAAGFTETAVRDRILHSPRPWERLYSKPMLDRIRRWYFPRDFFWTYVYCFLSTDERQLLDSVNPIDSETLQRTFRIHQHLSAETLDRLEPTIRGINTLMLTATSAIDFETRHSRLGGVDQLELPGI